MTDISHLSKDQQAVINADKGFAAYHRRMNLRDLALADDGIPCDCGQCLPGQDRECPARAIARAERLMDDK